MRLLLLSNSTNAGESYLDYPKLDIKEFLGSRIKKVLFIPYASVTFSYDEYTVKVQQRFDEIGFQADPVHRYNNPVKAVENAEAIAVGGGNTFRLVEQLYKNGLIGPVRDKVLNGTPYVGWSAGSNIACPTLCTTNDMPITEPESFKTFNLLPFQINPHYLDVNPAGHAGETREDRIREFIELNPGIYVAGLREGTMFLLEGNNLKLKGKKNCRVFIRGAEPCEYAPGSDFSFLLK